ncbi:tetratricopeptide repeat protein [Chitinivibrio alkaliphilus]|uniref:Uncharacterized protein n=1 Tax=Chitinivibrio alkaliphilus ACht1 TaxID=1313304 RepID=U7D679_9BACT|nr:tetratricopeptide repeat protein [Chitinivibrio alkaliphilus]ERP32024.1 hypothetical protein CALK_1005 [Chitinivibrio alkaliphilus ACht1]
MKSRALLLSFLFLISCAYFNTLYNGWEAYDTAYEQEQKLLSEGHDSARVTSRTAEQYERAVEKADKVFAQFPRSERFHPNAYFLRGIAAYRLGQYRMSLNSFQSLQAEFPQSSYIPESWLYLGRAYHAMGEYSLARNTYEYVLNSFPDLNENNRVTLLLAEVSAETDGRGGAVEFLITAYESAEEVGQKVYLIERISEYYYDLDLYDDALTWIARLPEFDDSYRSVFYLCDLRRIQILLAQQEYDHAAEKISQGLDRREYLEYRNELTYYRARVLLAQGEKNRAYRLFEEITYRSAADHIMASSWYTMATISLEVRGDLEQGRTELEEARSYAEGEMLQRIRRRLRGLTSVKEFRTAMEEERSENVSLDRYRVGEHFWLDVELPHKALAEFKYLLSDEDLSDSLRVKTLYSKAMLYRQVEADTLRSDSLFQSLIEEYPSSQAAQEAQNIMHQEVTVVTRRDSAAQRFRRSERLAERHDEYSEEVYYHYIITAMQYEDIPDIAAKALYAAGREASRRPTRRDDRLDTVVVQVYSRLCDSYPDSPQCAAVRPALETGAARGYLREYEERVAKEEEYATDPLAEEELPADEEPGEPTIPDFSDWF